MGRGIATPVPLHDPVLDLWTPEGSTNTARFAAGVDAADGEAVLGHVFHFVDKRTGKRSKATIVAEASASQAHIEDMAAACFERWLTKLREKEYKRPPSGPEERKEIGRAIREFRQYRARRNESTNHKLYY